MNEHDSGDVVWACATLVTLFVLNIRSANVEGGNRPAGMIRVTYSLYLICQTLQSISSVSNTDAGHHAQGIFLMIAGYSVAITGAALALGGGQAVSDSTKKVRRATEVVVSINHTQRGQTVTLQSCLPPRTPHSCSEQFQRCFSLWPSLLFL